MKEKIVFATNNLHKKEEIAKLLGQKYEVLCLSDLAPAIDIEENGNSFAENAIIKSRYVYEQYGLDCFADDSGLEVEALDNEPGIYSARYSGKKDDKANLNLLLERMTDKTNRKARFRTVISLMLGGKNHLFEGQIEGQIRLQAKGDQGFGYDPIFEPLGYDRTFAEMTLEEKNTISHRAIAMQALISFLNNTESLPKNS